VKATRVIEKERGCGFRKPSANGVGIYLVNDGPGRGCGRLPLRLMTCKACGHGIKPSRGWTWVMPHEAFGDVETCDRPAPECETCLLGFDMPATAGLLWIGEKFYAHPFDFEKEARTMGISRKVPALPRGFEVGKTVVYLAHRCAVTSPFGDDVYPGVFSAFIPTRVDLVIENADAIPSRAAKLAEQIEEQAGADAVRVIQVLREGIDTQGELDL
jgi:hypothetical protein